METIIRVLILKNENMKLKISTCKHCGSHKYNSLSYGDGNYVMECRICNKTTNANFDYIEVPFPTVVFPNGDIIKNLSNEVELFYNESTEFPFGVRIDVFTHEKSNYSDFTVRNITEFHYLFDSISGDEQVAFESNLHGTGSTRYLNVIKFIKISREFKIQKEYYS